MAEPEISPTDSQDLPPAVFSPLLPLTPSLSDSEASVSPAPEPIAQVEEKDQSHPQGNKVISLLSNDADKSSEIFTPTISSSIVSHSDDLDATTEQTSLTSISAPLNDDMESWGRWFEQNICVHGHADAQKAESVSSKDDLEHFNFDVTEPRQEGQEDVPQPHPLSQACSQEDLVRSVSQLLDEEWPSGPISNDEQQRYLTALKEVELIDEFSETASGSENCLTPIKESCELSLSNDALVASVSALLSEEKECEWTEGYNTFDLDQSLESVNWTADAPLLEAESSTFGEQSDDGDDEYSKFTAMYSQSGSGFDIHAPPNDGYYALSDDEDSDVSLVIDSEPDANSEELAPIEFNVYGQSSSASQSDIYLLVDSDIDVPARWSQEDIRLEEEEWARMEAEEDNDETCPLETSDDERWDNIKRASVVSVKSNIVVVEQEASPTTCESEESNFSGHLVNIVKDSEEEKPVSEKEAIKMNEEVKRPDSPLPLENEEDHPLPIRLSDSDISESSEEEEDIQKEEDQFDTWQTESVFKKEEEKTILNEEHSFEEKVEEEIEEKYDEEKEEEKEEGNEEGKEVQEEKEESEVEDNIDHNIEEESVGFKPGQEDETLQEEPEEMKQGDEDKEKLEDEEDEQDYKKENEEVEMQEDGKLKEKEVEVEVKEDRVNQKREEKKEEEKYKEVKVEEINEERVEQKLEDEQKDQADNNSNSGSELFTWDDMSESSGESELKANDLEAEASWERLDQALHYSEATENAKCNPKAWDDIPVQSTPTNSISIPLPNLEDNSPTESMESDEIQRVISQFSFTIHSDHSSHSDVAVSNWTNETPAHSFVDLPPGLAVSPPASLTNPIEIPEFTPAKSVHQHDDSTQTPATNNSLHRSST